MNSSNRGWGSRWVMGRSYRTFWGGLFGTLGNYDAIGWDGIGSVLFRCLRRDLVLFSSESLLWRGLSISSRLILCQFII